MIINWQKPTSFSLSDQDIFVWLIHIPECVEDISRDFELLDDHEKARAAAFKFACDKHSFIVSHVALRKILGRYLEIPAQTIHFEYNQYDKPHLSNLTQENVHFNLSHSHEYALIAITLNHEIGADIEQMQTTRDLGQIAERFFSQAEFEEYSSLLPDQKVEGFYNAWTRKEAFIKAIGEGLHYSLKDFIVNLTPGKVAKLESIKEGVIQSWQLMGFKPCKDYCAAIAVHCEKKNFQFYHYMAF